MKRGRSLPVVFAQKKKNNLIWWAGTATESGDGGTGQCPARQKACKRLELNAHGGPRSFYY